MITADSTRESVHAFAQAVRAALADLPADEVDELTDGLVADLFERAGESGGTDAFGDPADYADELRAAAGLPARSTSPRRSSGRDLRAAVVAASAALGQRVRANPVAAWLLDVAVSLRPMWWVIRGWTVWQVVTLVVWHTSFGLFPVYNTVSANAGQWLLLLGIVIVSVQWGRGLWLPGRWTRGVKVLASVGTIVALLPVAAFAVNDSHASYLYASSASSEPEQGLYSSGQPVYNIYAYDAEGNPLQNVRLYDQDGHPVYTVPDANNSSAPEIVIGDGSTYHLTRSALADGPLGWAVYPLQTTGPHGATMPYAQVQPLASATPTPEASVPATPTPSPAP